MTPKPAATRPSTRSFPIIWIVIGVVVVLGVVAVAVAASGGGSSDKTAKGVNQFGTPKISGTPLPRYEGQLADVALGMQAPTVKGANFRGQPVEIAPNGKARMIVFLAHWCPHCNAEAPRLAGYLSADGLPQNVDLTIVPTGSNSAAPNWPPSEWVKTMGIENVPTVVDDKDQTVAAAYGLSSYPFIVMLDASGKVVARREGEQVDGFFAEAFRELSAGQPIKAGTA